jgi:hypothetical protein
LVVKQGAVASRNEADFAANPAFETAGSIGATECSLRRVTGALCRDHAGNAEILKGRTETAIAAACAYIR